MHSITVIHKNIIYHRDGILSILEHFLLLLIQLSEIFFNCSQALTKILSQLSMIWKQVMQKQKSIVYSKVQKQTTLNVQCEARPYWTISTPLRMSPVSAKYSPAKCNLKNIMWYTYDGRKNYMQYCFFLLYKMQYAEIERNLTP